MGGGFFAAKRPRWDASCGSRGAGHPDAEPRSKTFCLPGFSTKLEIWAIGLLVRTGLRLGFPESGFAPTSGGAETHKWAFSVMGFWVGGGSYGRLGEARCAS